MATLRASIGNRRMMRFGWGIQVGVCSLLIVNALILYLVVFEAPQEKTMAILLGGVGALALAIAARGYQQSSEWSWRAMWIVVGILAVLGVHLLIAGRFDLGALYLVLGGGLVVGQMLARRRETSSWS